MTATKKVTSTKKPKSYKNRAAKLRAEKAAKTNGTITVEETMPNGQAVPAPESASEKKKRLAAVKDMPKKLKDMVTRDVDFDGEKAEAWLTKNRHNRPVQQSQVKRFAYQMSTGEFKKTSQGISINRRGMVQDGQHRLMAIVEYYNTYDNPKPVTMRVTEGEEDHFAFFDQGKNRSTADVLSIEGEEFANELGNAARLLWIRYYGKRVGGAGKVSPYQLSEFIKDEPFSKLRDSVKFVMQFGQDEDSMPCKALMSPGYAACLHFLMRNADGVEAAKTKADEFWTQVIDQDAKKGSTPYKLYRRINKIHNDPAVKLNRDGLVDMVITAFNNWVDGIQTLPNVISDKPSLGGYDGGGINNEQ